MDDILVRVWTQDICRKLILSAAVWLGAFLLGRLLSWLVTNRLPDESPHIYPVRKVAGYVVNGLAILLTIGIWLKNIGSFSVRLGILADSAAAGIVVASQTAAVVQLPSTAPQGQSVPVASDRHKELHK